MELGNWKEGLPLFVVHEARRRLPGLKIAGEAGETEKEIAVEASLVKSRV